MHECIKPDETLIQGLKQQVAAGAVYAFNDLFNLFAARLTKFAYSIVKDREAAIDIVDEVFIKLWKRKEDIVNIDHIITYLYTATKNTALNHLSRKIQRSYQLTDDFINIRLTDDERPDVKLISSELFDKIRKAVEALPPRCKIIFKLVREDGLKYKQVAEVLGISEKTVDAQMVIAVKRIADNVSIYFDHFPARFQKK
ncbi:MAG: RNA polymerase sigma-70 factor [Niabella sp.]